MKHHSTGRRGLFFKINARKKGIALILIVSLALPYVSTAFWNSMNSTGRIRQPNSFRKSCSCHWTSKMLPWIIFLNL